VWSIFHNMKTIQVVLDSLLLQAAECAARRARLNRSALIRKALREYLKPQHTRELEARDRRGHELHPPDSEEAAAWERVASWPEFGARYLSEAERGNAVRLRFLAAGRSGHRDTAERAEELLWGDLAPHSSAHRSRKRARRGN